MWTAASSASWVICEQKRLLEIDFMDLTARREILTHARSQPTLMQVPIVPAYALTVRKDMNKSSKDRTLHDSRPSHFSSLNLPACIHARVSDAIREAEEHPFGTQDTSNVDRAQGPGMPRRRLRFGTGVCFDVMKRLCLSAADPSSHAVAYT